MRLEYVVAKMTPEWQMGRSDSEVEMYENIHIAAHCAQTARGLVV